jgi:hypothetical protein
MFLNVKIIIFCKRDELTAKSRSEIGRVNKPLSTQINIRHLHKKITTVLRCHRCLISFASIESRTLNSLHFFKTNE